MTEHLRQPHGGTQDLFFPRSAAADIPTIVSGNGLYLIDDRIGGGHGVGSADSPPVAGSTSVSLPSID